MHNLDDIIDIIVKKSKISYLGATFFGDQKEYEHTLKGVFREKIYNKQEISEIKTYFSVKKQDIPFGELVYPFLHYGKKITLNRSDFSHLSEKAMEDLDSILLEKLSKTSSQAFFFEFSGELGVHKYESMFDTLLESTKDTTDRDIPRDKYEDFISDMLQNRLIDFFIKYPVLAMLMASLTVQWIHYVEKFIDALNRDFEDITKDFFSKHNIGDVASIWSVDHNGFSMENTTLGITFGHRSKLIYKSRNIETDRAFNRFMEWIGIKCKGLLFKTIPMISGGNYGWVEFVPQKICLNESEVKRYYMRAGMMLGVLYALGSRDMHCNNLIACGEHPVLIDMEALTGKRCDTDVLHTYFLPVDFINADGSLICSNALGAETYTRSIIKELQWEKINTDEMKLVRRYKDKNPKSVVFLNDKKMYSFQYVQQILEGYDCVYKFIMNNKKEVHERISRTFMGNWVRFFPRVNRSYLIAMHNSILPKYLKSGMVRLETLKKVLDRSIVKEELITDDFKRYEMDLIYNNVLPRFNVDFDYGALKEVDGITVTDFLIEVPLKCVEKRIHRFCISDYEKQRMLIIKAFDTYKEYVVSQEMELNHV